ncbi:inner-membrane translocator [Streptomyces sp. NPDC060030]|uniref:inner-membrane translocator n=1 Tax=Streptomyces sp. NPDC060030 TaxID=3347042 RepID=UPI0036CB2B70
MPELDDKQPSGRDGALTAGCLLLLVLVVDAAAALLVVIALAVRGLGRMDAGTGQTATGVPPMDWAPVLGFGTLALAAGTTAVVLLRFAHRTLGAVQLTLCVFLTFHTLEIWL